MAVDNSTLAQAVWLQGGNDFQQRVPEPSVHGLAQTMNALFQPMNRAYLNQFMDILINKVAFTVVRGKRWQNPLAVFEKRKVDYGATIEEIALKWITAHSYRDDWGDRVDDITNLLKVNRPDGSVAYHSVNRQDTYPISINEAELMAAFKSENGLNELVSRIMELPANADAYDTYRIMLQLIAMYEANWGFFKVYLSAAPTDETTGKEFLTKIRTVAGKLRFPSSLYNALSVQDIPTFADASELVLLITPEAQANLDVQTLASVFNLDLAEIKYRTIVVDEFPIPDAVALLTTEDFFVVHDVTYMTTSFFNPQTLTTNYYLHHRSINSVSPFVPAVLFTTADATDVPAVVQGITGLTFELGTSNIDYDDFENAVLSGGDYRLVSSAAALVGTLFGTPQDNLSVQPQACTYEIGATVSGATVSGDTVTAVTVELPLSVFTYVDRFGKLHLQDDMISVIGHVCADAGIDPDDSYTESVITVTAHTTYINPSGSTPSGLVASDTLAIRPRFKFNPS